MVRIAVVGIGFMGSTHFRAAQGVKGANVSAIVTRDPKKQSGNWEGIRGNFGPDAGRVDLTGVKVYDSLNEVLTDPDIDLVDLCLPTHLHHDAVHAVLKAGKHVLVEKPIALTVDEADRLVAAASASGRRLFVGQVLRFFPEFSFVKSCVDDGRYGDLRALQLRRMTSGPSWGSDDWFDNPQKSGGMVIDLHVHDVDFVQHLLGMPTSLVATGIVGGNDVRYVSTQFHFGEDGPAVTAQGGSLSTDSLPFAHAYEAYFEKAAVVFDSTSGGKVRVFEAGAEPADAPLEQGDGFERELQYVVDTLEGRASGDRLSATSARNSLYLCHRVIESTRSGRQVEIQRD